MDFHEKDDDIIRSSRSQMFFKIGVFENFATFTGKHLCWGTLFNKVEGLKASYTGLKDSCTGFFQ